MSVFKIKNADGEWVEVPAIKGQDGAIQYTAGDGIQISEDHVISCTYQNADEVTY